MQRPPCADRPRTLVVIGPSGCGKSSVVRLLAERGVLHVHPTWTTRPRRADEVEGSLEHRFVSDREFDELEASGFFLETVSLFGLPFRYGLPPLRRSVDRRVDTVMLRAPLVQRFAAIVPDHVVFQIEDSPERAEERLRTRGCDSDELRARLEDNRRELALGHAVADRVFVNQGSIEALADAIEASL